VQQISGQLFENGIQIQKRHFLKIITKNPNFD